MAYYFSLSLFPLVRVMLAVTGNVGSESAFGRTTEAIQPPVPDDAWHFVTILIRESSEKLSPVRRHLRTASAESGTGRTRWLS